MIEVVRWSKGRIFVKVTPEGGGGEPVTIDLTPAEALRLADELVDKAAPK